MANPNSSFDSLVTTTLNNYSGTLTDNVTNNNPFWQRLSKNGMMKPAGGGVKILQEIDWDENDNAMWYSGYDSLDISQNDPFTAAEYNWKQLSGAVTISGLEKIQNRSKEQVHNLLTSKMTNLRRTLANTMATATFADGTGSSGKEIGGLQLLVADTNTNTVGGINAGTYSFWQNQAIDVSAVQTSGASSTTIQTHFNQMYINTTRGADMVDLIPTDGNYWKYYLESLQANQRFTSDDKAMAGFNALKFMNADVFFDSSCPANHAYFLNTDFLFMRPASTRKQFTALPPRNATNQDASVHLMVWAGNMTTSNRNLQGVIHD